MKTSLFKLRGQVSAGTQLKLAVLGFILLVLVFEFYARAVVQNSYKVPAPSQIVLSLPQMFAPPMNLSHHWWHSMVLTLASYAEAVAIALPLGYLLGLSPLARYSFVPSVTALRYLPWPAAIVLFMKWFGIGFFMKVQFLTTCIVVYLTLSVVQRIVELDEVYEDTARTCGARTSQIISSVYLRGLLAPIWNDALLLVPVSWTYITVIEMINAGEGGIGTLTHTASRLNRTDWIFATLLVILLTGVVLDAVGRGSGRRMFPWYYLRKGGE